MLSLIFVRLSSFYFGLFFLEPSVYRKLQSTSKVVLRFVYRDSNAEGWVGQGNFNDMLAIAGWVETIYF